MSSDGAEEEIKGQRERFASSMDEYKMQETTIKCWGTKITSQTGRNEQNDTSQRCTQNLASSLDSFRGMGQQLLLLSTSDEDQSFAFPVPVYYTSVVLVAAARKMYYSPFFPASDSSTTLGSFGPVKGGSFGRSPPFAENAIWRLQEEQKRRRRAKSCGRSP